MRIEELEIMSLKEQTYQLRAFASMPVPEYLGIHLRLAAWDLEVRIMEMIQELQDEHIDMMDRLLEPDEMPF